MNNDQGIGSWDEVQGSVNKKHDKYGGKFKNWRLPTKKKLKLMYQNKNKMRRFQPDTYWSAREINGDSVWRQNFQDSDQDFMNKMVPYYMRAARDF